MAVEPQARRNRLMLVAAATVLILALLVLARGALFPFILSGALAYLLFPIVKRLESWMPWCHRWPGASRIVAILVIYVVAIAAVVGALAIIIPPAVRQTTEFIDDIPELFASARETIEGWNERYSGQIPEDVRAEIEKTLKSSSSVFIGAAKSVVGRTLGAVTNTITTVIGLAIVPFMLFYLLKDREVAAEGFYSLMPVDVRRHARSVIAIINQVLGAYIRAQLTLSFVVGLMAFLGLFALGIRFPMLLGIVAGVFEVVPVIGPLLGAIPGVLVTLATSPSDLVWVVLLYVIIQLLENTLLVPRLQGQAVDIHPAIIMVILVVGSEAAGLFGVILAVPLAAVARDVFKYFYREWSELPAVAPAAPVEAGTDSEADEGQEPQDP